MYNGLLISRQSLHKTRRLSVGLGAMVRNNKTTVVLVVLLIVCVVISIGFTTLRQCSSGKNVRIDSFVNEDMRAAASIDDVDELLNHYAKAYPEYSISVSVHKATRKVACIVVCVPSQDLAGNTTQDKIRTLQKTINPKDSLTFNSDGYGHSGKGDYVERAYGEYDKVLSYATYGYSWILREWEHDNDAFVFYKYNWDPKLGR